MTLQYAKDLTARAFATLLVITTFTSVGACTSEEEGRTAPDRLDELDELDEIVDNDALDSLAAPSSPDSKMICSGTFSVDDVWSACEGAYDYAQQVGQCYLNICSCYTCVE